MIRLVPALCLALLGACDIEVTDATCDGVNIGYPGDGCVVTLSCDESSDPEVDCDGAGDCTCVSFDGDEGEVGAPSFCDDAAQSYEAAVDAANDACGWRLGY